MHRRLVEDSRSYSGTETNSDHKIVIAKLKLQWWKMKTMNMTKSKVDIDKFNEGCKVAQYKQGITKKMKEHEQEIQSMSTDNRWEKIVTICKETAELVLGNRKSGDRHRYEDQEIQDLSKSQKILK